MPHLHVIVGFVKVEHHHSSAFLQLDGCHVDGWEHILKCNLH